MVNTVHGPVAKQRERVMNHPRATINQNTILHHIWPNQQAVSDWTAHGGMKAPYTIDSIQLCTHDVLNAGALSQNNLQSKTPTTKTFHNASKVHHYMVQCNLHNQYYSSIAVIYVSEMIIII